MGPTIAGFVVTAHREGRRAAIGPKRSRSVTLGAEARGAGVCGAASLLPYLMILSSLAKPGRWRGNPRRKGESPSGIVGKFQIMI